MSDVLKFTIGGERASDHFDKYKEAIPGSSWDGVMLNYKNGKYHHKASVYKDLLGVEIVVFSIYSENNIIIKEAEHTQNMIIIRAAKQSLSYNTEKKIVEVCDKQSHGAFLYTDSSDTELFIPKETYLEMVSIRFSLATFEGWTHGRFPELKAYFSKVDDVMLYETLTHKMSVLLNKLFSVQALSFGKKGYSIVHGLEFLLLFGNELQKRAFGEESLHLTPYDQKRMLLIKSELLDNLSDPPSTEDICVKYGLSAQKLRNDFKTVFGLPPYKFVLKQRYEIAYQALVSQKKSIKEVALDLGFANSNHFNKAFTKYFGISAGKVIKAEMIAS